MADLHRRYVEEKMPKRFSTRKALKSWTKNYIIPTWGNSPITDLQAREVDLWLKDLSLSPKSKQHLRDLIRQLWNFAFYCRVVPIQVNPMTLVKIEGASKSIRKARSLTVEEYQKLIPFLPSDARVIFSLCACLGLRISECLALKWSDVDWLNAEVNITRGTVNQHVDDVKTACSKRPLPLSEETIILLKNWRQSTQFKEDPDWLFASPEKIGREPRSYTYIWKQLTKASEKAGIGHVSSHSGRHTNRSLLDAVGTGLAVQQKMMRHADIRTTINVYGDVITDEMKQAASKVAKLASGK